MRAPWVQGSWTVQPHFNCVFVAELNNVVSPESKQRQPRRVFAFSERGSCLINNLVHLTAGLSRGVCSSP